MPNSSLAPSRPFAAAVQVEAPPGTSHDGPRHPSLFLFVVLTAQLMVVLDSTIVNVALPHIQRSLDFSSAGLSWVLNAYILTFGGLLLLGARAGDILGRRRTFLTGIALFSVSSLLGGFATTGWMLLGARAIQGVGAALAAPSSLSLLTTVFAEGPARVRAIGLFTTMSAAGGATGLVAGGLLTDLVSWRWVMFVNVPIGLAILILGRRVLVETPRRRGRFDLIGAVTSTLGMSAIVFGLVETASDGWTSPLTVGSFAVGATLLGVFLRNEGRVAEPILPLRLLTHSGRSTANAARGLLYAGMYGMFFFMSQFLQDVQSYSPLRAGIAFLPMPASVFLASQLTSRRLVERVSSRRLMLAGAGLATAGLAAASRLQPGAGYGQILLTLVLVGTGSGISFVSLTSASLADVQPADAGAASGLVNVSQQIGAALGLAVLVTVFGSLTHHARFGSPVSGVALEHARSVLTNGLDDVFAVGALFTVTALALVGALIRPGSRQGQPIAGEADAPEARGIPATSDSVVAEPALLRAATATRVDGPVPGVEVRRGVAARAAEDLTEVA
jgi:EmrB/QacA subfamily drug resistance transporter